MKRKIVKQGGSVLTISLPSKWARKYDLQAGEEIELTENGRNLILSTSHDIAISEIEVDLTQLTDKTIRYIVSSLHKSGYDHITFRYEQAFVPELIQELMRDLLIGFIITEQTPKSIAIKSVAKDSDEEFDITLKRAFQVTLSLADSFYEALSKNEIDTLSSLIQLEKSNNQLTNFCERILNKRGFREHGKTCFYYVIVWNLEKVADDYKDMCKYLLANPAPPTEKTLIFLGKVNQFFRSFYNLFYSFSENTLDTLSQEKKTLCQEYCQLIHDSSEDIFIRMKLYSLLDKCTDFSASTTAVHKL